MRNEIILIGPMLAGKSTAALILSKHLNKPVVSLDKIKWDYFSEYGLTPIHADELLMKKGVNELINYYSPYEALIVEKILEEHTNCIFDFGAGFSVFKDECLQHKINKLLLDYANIFLILPTKDTLVNKRIYRNRLKNRLIADPDLLQHHDSIYDLILYFSEHSANMTIAKYIIYTHRLNETQLVKQVTAKIRS